MKAKNATPGTRVRHKITGAVGTVVSDDDCLGDVVAVHYDDLPSTMMARPAHLRLADKTVAPLVSPHRGLPPISVRRGGVRYPQPRPAYLLPGVHEDTDPYLAERVRELGAEFGPVVVAIVAAQMTDPNYLIARLLNTGYQPPQRGAEQQPDVPGPSDGAAPADGPGPGEAEIRVLPVPNDDELLCILRNTGRVPVWVRGMGGGQFVAVAPDVTVEVPRTWAALPGGAAAQPVPRATAGGR